LPGDHPVSAARTAPPSSSASDAARASRAARRRGDSLVGRVVALVLVAVGVTTLAVGTLAYRRARTALTETAEARLDLLGRDVAHAVHRELMSRVVDTTTWARLEIMIALGFGDVDKQVADFLGHARGTSGDLVALVARDLRGAVVASVGAAPATELGTPPSEDRVVVVAGSAGATIRIDAPVLSSRRSGERLGTLSAFVDPAWLLQRLGTDRALDGAIGIALRTGGANVAAVGASRGDEAMLETRTRLERLRAVSAPELEVVAWQPTSLALASVYDLRRTLVWIGALVMLASGCVGGVVALRLTMPIRRLTESVEAIASRGRPEPIAVPPGAVGEVGTLATAFASTMERLAVAEREVIAQSRLAVVGEIAASIAHDVRTPLSVLKTSAQLLADPAVSPSEQRDLAAMISSEVDRVNGVVTRLVDLARPRATLRSRHDAQALVQRVVAVLEPWSRARGVRIRMVVPAGLTIDVDGDEMQQALLNVVHNAVQACGQGGEVVVTGAAEPGFLRVDVSDTGAGFADDAIAHAFSPFFTTKADGTGLGLAIVRRVVEAHGGEVGVGNRADGGGAIVWLRLPAVSPSSSSPR